MVMRVSSSWLRCISFKVAPSPMLWSSLTPLIGQGYSQSYRYSGQLRSTCNCTLMDDSYRYGGQLRSTCNCTLMDDSYRYGGQLRSICDCTLMDDSYRYGGQLRSTLMGVVVEPSRP